MGVACGIVGLPTVGKTSVFNALTGLSAERHNYVASSVEPNLAEVDVPDERLETIHRFIGCKRNCVINAAILGIGFSHRMDRLGVDALRTENVIRPTGYDVRNESFGMLLRRLAVARHRSVEEHDFTQRIP